jgi:hypothetical protein
MNVRNVRNGGIKPTPESPSSSPSPRTPRSSHPPYLLIFLALLLGCHSSPGKQQEKLRQEQKSWEATARLTDELAQRGAVPMVYRHQVMEKTSKSLQKIRTQIDQLTQ